MTKKIKCITIKSSERSQYPDWYSKTELKKMKLMPKKNVKPVGLVERKFYDDYYVYDINKTQPFSLTKKEKDELNKKARIRRKKRLEQKKIEDEKNTCKVCNKHMTYKERVYDHSNDTILDYICKDCYKYIYEEHKKEYITKLMSKNIICIDVETTGLYAAEDEILQISIMNGKGEILLNTYCKPEFKTSWKEAELIHGITLEKVQDCKPYRFYKKTVESILKSCDIIIGYNVDFDLNFLLDDWLEFFKGKDIYIQDVMFMFSKVYGEWSRYYKNYKWKSLEVCSEYYNYKFNAHDSLEDVRATLYCYPLVSYDYNFNIYDYI